MIDSIRCPKCASDQVSAQVRTADEEKDMTIMILTEEEEVLAELPVGDRVDMHCLTCGHNWNHEDLLRQKQEDQEQADALDFGERKQTFYDEFESGQFAYAKRLVPKEARLIYKREGLYAAYKYLKSLDKELTRFRNTFMLIGIGVLLFIVGIIAYACD